jgi:hypothetical protein
LRFAKTFRGVDHRKVNEFLLKESPIEDRIALFGLPDDVDYTVAMLAHPRVSALKMYWSYLEPPATRIYEFFPPPVLEEAQTLGLPIILHLPRVITKCAKDLEQLLADFPRLRVVLAHLGVTKFVIPGLEEVYRKVAEYPQVTMDTSLVPSADVVALSVKTFGIGRIMFGSDEPLHLLRAKAYEHPVLGQRIMTEYPYHWLDPKEHAEFRSVAAGAPHSHWTCLSAIREALEKLSKGERRVAKERLFCGNAKYFFRF